MSPLYPHGTARPFAKRFRDAVVSVEAHESRLDVNDWFWKNGLGREINGTYRFGSAADGSLAASESSPADMNITIAPGGAIVNGQLSRVEEATLVSLTPITSQLRWDIICLSEENQLSVVEGEVGEASDPDVGALLSLYRVVHVVGESCIKLTDDSTNGYVEDIRVWVN